MSAIPETKSAAELELETRFHQLGERWLAETANLSSTTAMIEHSAFRDIVAMGEAVIPLVLREMEKGTGHWDLALGEITGEKPFPPEDAGKIRRIESAWFRWAAQNGYVW